MSPDSTRSELAQEVRSMAHGIVSAGYEGRTLEEFVPALQRAGVQTVADVRRSAVSRAPGFSKSPLLAALRAVGITYRHLPSLGKEPSNSIWEGRPGVAETVYRELLVLPAAEIALHELAYLATDHVVAVLCFERDVRRCHRKVIIDEVLAISRVPVADLPDPDPSLLL